MKDKNKNARKIVRENIENSNRTQQRTSTFRISTGITRPRHVFVFIINDANINVQTVNPFLYNAFSVIIYPRTLNSCYLEVVNGNNILKIVISKVLNRQEFIEIF